LNPKALISLAKSLQALNLSLGFGVSLSGTSEFGLIALTLSAQISKTLFASRPARLETLDAEERPCELND